MDGFSTDRFKSGRLVVVDDAKVTLVARADVFRRILQDDVGNFEDLKILIKPSLIFKETIPFVKSYSIYFGR